jgi:hypothetical protein
MTKPLYPRDTHYNCQHLKVGSRGCSSPDVKALRCAGCGDADTVVCKRYPNCRESRRHQWKCELTKVEQPMCKFYKDREPVSP